MSIQNKKTALVAFSGGLDTSMLVPYMRKHYDIKEVITCVVDTGGMDEAEKQQVAARAKEVGADQHLYINASQPLYDEIIKFLIYGNVSRDGYPLCVGSERVIQAREVIAIAKKKGISLVANGCTGAGNDQYRFDLAVYVMTGKNKSVQSVAPVREHELTREFSQNFLREHTISVPEKAQYSYNVGLWGLSIGGKETHTSTGLIPEHAWYSQIDKALQEMKLELTFKQGEPVQLAYGEKQVEGPLKVIRELAVLGGKMGIGRHYHVGTSIPGKKGRIAYESPAADIIYEAHRTLEKHTLTQAQIFHKQTLSNEFGRLIHEAYFFDPLMEDLRAYLESSQKRVSGVCHISLKPGQIASVTVHSSNDLLESGGSVYGEHADFYDAKDAEGSAKLHAYEQVIYHSIGNE